MSFTNIRQSAITIGLPSIFLAVCGVGLIVWALLSRAFRNAEGFIQGTICLPVSIAFALWILSLFIGRQQWRLCGFWVALSFAGQAVTLQLIDAGKAIHFQHYRVAKLPEVFPWHLAFIGLQLATVLIGFRSVRVWRWLRERYKSWALGFIFAAIVMSSATLSRQPAEYVAELAFSTFLELVNLGSILLAAYYFPQTAVDAVRGRLHSLMGDDTILPLRQEQVVLSGALWVLTATAFLAYFVYQNHPHVEDEVIYLFQARYFADGHLTIDAPAVPEAFSVYLAQFQNGRLYAPPPAGWAPVLALGILAGVPWLVNPLLGCLNIILAFLVCRHVIGARYARLSILLLCTSPWFIFMSMNFMMHTLTFTCALIATLGVIQCRKTAHARWAWMAGAVIGYVSLIRPLDGVLLALILGLWSIGVGGTRLPVRSVAALVLGTTLVGSLVFPYNWYLTGSPTKFPINLYVDEHFGPGLNDIGFGPNKGVPFGEGMDAFPGHGLPDVIANGLLNTASLNTELFGWACGSLIIILLLLFSGRMSRLDIWMLGAVILTFLIFSTYWFSGGPDFGARYWYLMLLPLLILTVSGIRHLEKETGQSIRVVAAVLTLALFSVLNYMPWRAIDKYYHYLLMRPDVRRIAAEQHLGKDLVLINGDNHPDYASAWVYNPLSWNTNAPIYASLANRQLCKDLLKAYPGRRIWVIDGPSVTKGGYRISGPLNADQILQTVIRSH